MRSCDSGYVLQSYKVSIDGNVVAMTTNNSIMLEGLSPGTSHVIIVTSHDNAKDGDYISIIVTTPPAERGQLLRYHDEVYV